MTDQTQAATPERVAAGAPDIQSRVRAGATWLDQHRPGWVGSIDLITLDVADPECCVLGQVCGYWPSELNSNPVAEELGFFVDRLDGGYVRLYTEVETGYAALTTAWRDLIEGRLTDEVRRIAAACCLCRGPVCDPGCTCPSRTCPKTDAEVTDE